MAGMDEADALSGGPDTGAFSGGPDAGGGPGGGIPVPGSGTAAHAIGALRRVGIPRTDALRAGGTPVADDGADIGPAQRVEAGGGSAAPDGHGSRVAAAVRGSGAGTGLWGRFEQQDFRSRVRGALLGAAIGDALGTAAGPGRVGAATQLTLFTLDGLIRAHVRRDTGAWHPPTDVHRAYLRWAATQRDWGPDERRPDNGWLGRQEWLYSRRDPDRASLTGFADDVLGTLDQPKNPTARDAAAATRSAPFGLLVGWEPALVFQLSVECAAQSHGHPSAYLSAGAFAALVHGLTRGDSPESAAHRALGLLAARPGHEPVAAALQGALAAVTQGPPTPERVEALSPTADAEHTLAVAVYCALVAEDIPHGLRLATHHAADSAGAAALCGALLGALHGETALPAAPLAALEGRATLLELADDFALEMTQGPALHGPATAATAGSTIDSTTGWTDRYPPL